MKKLSIAVVALALLFGVLAGCSSAQKSAAKAKVTDAAKGPVCTAIATAETKLANAKDESADQLQEAQSKAVAAKAAITALGDQVPAALSTQVDQATQQFSDAIDNAKTNATDVTSNATEAKTKVQTAAANLSSKLDEVKTQLGC